MSDRMNELVALLTSECKTVDDVQNLLKDLFKGTLEAKLDDEMDRYLQSANNTDSKNKTGNSRNGYNKKRFQSQFGEIEIRVPRDRNGNFKPQIIGKYQTKTEHLEEQIISMYAKGMSNRDIEAHMRDIYGVCASASLISKITDKIMPDVAEWQNRPLDHIYPIVIFDGITFKVRSEGRVTDKQIYSVLGINKAGCKEILGIWITDSTSVRADSDTSFWKNVFDDLHRRGVCDIFIAYHSNLSGFSDVMESEFPETAHQLCLTRIYNAVKAVTSNDSEAIMADLMLIFCSASLNEAVNRLEVFHRRWNQKYPEILVNFDANRAELTTYYRFPEEVRRLIFTTKSAEEFHQILRKFTKKKTIYPTEDAVRKSIYLSVREISKNWDTRIKDWDKIMVQLKNHFGKRLTE